MIIDNDIQGEQDKNRWYLCFNSLKVLSIDVIFLFRYLRHLRLLSPVLLPREPVTCALRLGGSLFSNENHSERESVV